MIKQYFTVITLFTLIAGCSSKQEPVAKATDYEKYLHNFESGYRIESDIAFWNQRLKRNPGDQNALIKLAGLHSAQFKKSGSISDLDYSDSLYIQLLKSATSEKPDLYLALAQNAITRHHFRESRQYAEAALKEGGRKAASLLVLSDAVLELGDPHYAINILKQFTNKKSFAHRIRQVKVKDQQGDLDSAIVIMEQAFARVKGNKDLYCWSLSNLGDMYGHAGRVGDAYRAYLSVLEKDPSYDYALKGIAWILLSHDHNYAEAKRIITHLTKRKYFPEGHLMLAEIAACENNHTEKTKHLIEFVSLTDQEGYKAMYAKYLASIFSDELGQPDLSLSIAEAEIHNRPTPQSYILKAWALLKLGKDQEALSVASQYVQDKTFEPDALYRLGMIFLANGDRLLAEKYLSEALKSSFELGPIVTRDIKTTLRNM